MIPKLIHFIWIPGFEKAPEYAFKNIEKWRHLNPDYKVCVWEEKDILEIIHPSRIDVFRTLSNIKKADFARLELIINFGGCYFDCDLAPENSLKNFLNKRKIEKPKTTDDAEKIKYIKVPCDISKKKLILSREWKNPKLRLHIFTPRNRSANGIIIAEKENLIITRFLEIHYKETGRKVLNYLGPHALTRFLERNCGRFDQDDLAIIPPQHFLWEDKVGKMPKWSISRHMGKNTWGDHTKHDFWNVT